MAFFRQLRLLMWKNFLLQRKKICVTVFEIVLPLLFGVIFFSMRFLVDIRHEPAQSYYTRDVARRVSYYWYGDVTVLFTPNNTLINGLITDINGTLHNHTSTYAYSSLPTFRGFSSRKDMLDYYSYNSKQVGFAVEFDNVAMTDTVLPKTLRCAIRPKGDRYGGWHTTESTPFVASSVPRSLYGPDYQDFLGVQRLLHEAIIKHFNPNSTPILNELEVQMLRMPYPPYIVDTMNALLRYMFPVLLMLSFILMAIQTTKGVVYEKERKLKESMKLMGLSASAHWTSLFLTSFIYVLVIMALYALLCGVNASGKGAALAKSDPSLFFVFLLCYGVSIISYCFMISVFTQRANIGAAISGIVFFISYCPYFYLQITYQTMSRPAKLASCLLFNVGMAFGANVISLYEGAGSGVQWSNFHEPATVDDNFSLLDAILMLLGDTAIHLLITWYMDNVWPGEFGVPKPFHFPFTASYWCGTKQRNADYSSNQHLDEKHFEKEPSGMKTGISILNLKKVFGSGSKKKVAVDGMSLNMFEGQISVLLGHNGAGKTTTMSVLTGFIPSSGGTAIVNGYDINNDIQSVRQSLGLCPQHNILFDSLTVQEHLEFFACLKGCPSNAVQSEVITMINEVGLSQKRFTQSQHLSGGQKRKLSVGIALIGGSKIVILDEPTSGMDPAARRQTWDILQRNRQGRTMLLTTHFMDEADLLGDRIAIMTEGVVKCCGTSYFLKKLYGAGYHLVMVKEPTCQVPSVTAVVQRYVPTAVMESEINAELSYLLPDDQSVNFAALFTEIEIHRGKLGISSFGASATTMEEVFLKAGEEEQKEDGDVNEDYPTGSRNNLISNGTNGWTNGNYEMREAGTADILGLATLLSVFMMTTLDKKPEANIADWVFLVIFPHYNFGKSYMDMYSNYLYLDGCIKQNYTSLCATPRRNGCCKDSCGDSCYPFTENFLDWDSPGVGRYVVFMLFQGIMYMSVTLFIEYQIPQRIWYAFRPQETEVPQPGAPSFSPMQQVPEDGDVLRERQRIDEFAIGAGNSDALVLKDVYKRYGNFVAVDHLSVGIPEKECFGLLGQNGAGKTTTFKMITGDVMLTHGNVFLRSFNIKNHTQKVQENMGYCPQFDALIDQMTGRETLTMYARLKGVPESCIKGVCDNLLDIMMLRQYSDKATSEYSGGNKRKLSTAIALVGDPAFIMLDEPSTGMDPKARRQLWNVLSKVRECGRTLVLTSHSMEECDALCTRIAIMVNGRFMCLGTPQHLKTKFGQGYTLIARMKTVETQPGVSDERAPAPTEPLVNFITSSYPNTHVFDDHQGYVHFQVPYNAVSLAQVFTLMEQSKVQFSVEDYSVHQTTLEQVFLSFTRWQIPPKEDKTSLCKRICCCC
ncbi:phospholipid-transporting ATPase ABCA3-like isoform X3 [Haliotis rufescens]|uniref:phospholipid-transporting ATPase ABCA3-like isoform X3 n=1 Tax=Haliotis rufescens TaxID=6454 RepID=UPI00201F0DD9|nr:phospholipid-transporting ATPase ABCA3-like isoform X3 [Haliotis rufescens]